ncbi:MAG: ImmA/IrrE family metallo-endopeptidase [Gemmataceae bacterium]|nr:ImmA/IrrE family metallo-endopeptidase [Gemmataceae bacterium]MCI0738524.1 ImmA/IrrE family metallo-endopeptidase [Gemmataceae bacterium]
MRKLTVSREPTVPYLPKQQIEEEAALLLAEFGGKHGIVTAPPIPIDEIVELYQLLTVEFKDMQVLFGVGDVHGALWVNDKLVGVDMSLDPSKYPAKRGRYHFTLAHEAGHWRLHRRIYQRRRDQPLLKLDGVEQPNYVCRSSDKNPIETQANYFASYLLMPREMVKRIWHEWRGSMSPIYLPDLRAQASHDATDELLLENGVRPLASRFQVSSQALRIRLEELGLVLWKKETSLFD